MIWLHVRPKWRRRLIMAALALLVLAIATLFVAGRAEAAPRDLCSPAEWRTPGNWSTCADRFGSTIARTAQCVAAPVPDDPAAGFPGWVTSRPDADMRLGITGRYSTYGVAGYRVTTFGQGCAGAVTHPEDRAWTAVANLEFQAGAWILGITGSLREDAYAPGEVWGFMDGFINDVVDKSYRYVFAPGGLIGAALIGLWLLWRARAGRLSEAAKVASWAVLVMVVVTGVSRHPLWAAHGVDAAGEAGLSVVHGALGPGGEGIPADRCHSVDPAACQDHRIPAVRTSDTVMDSILYRAWLRAEFGSADSATAQTYGPALFDAQTLSWGESADAAKDPKLREAILKAKADRWTAVVESVKAEDPVAYSYLRGDHGTDRVGSGLVGWLSALVFAVFDSAASLVVLFGFLVVRLATIVLPGLAVVGILHPASGPLKRLGHAVVSSLFNIVLFGAFSAMYCSATRLVLASGLPGLMQIAAVGLAGVGCWLLLRPVRRFKLSAGSQAAAEENSRRFRWLRGAADEVRAGVREAYAPAGAGVRS